MLCNKAKLLSRSNAARSFFSLFYDWSLMSSPGVVRRSASTKAPRSLSLFKPRCMKIPSSQSRQYSVVQNQVGVHKAEPNPNPSEEPPLSSHLRNIMRVMPHSVVVATSTTPSPDRGSPTSFKGMTVSSFTTLTLTPNPIITFNIRKPSQTLTAISKSKRFLIHILSSTESGARVADAFTKGNGNGSDVFRNPSFTVLRKRGDVAAQSLEPPLLASEGITKVLRCELLEDKGLVEVGDHVLILGKVVSIIEPSMDQDVEQRGLCYLDRAYRQVGTVIELPETPLSSES